jgi:DNA-binding IscR family transcriptional regulator
VNSRFTVANHVLTLLALFPGEWLTSEYIAGSVNTNPVVVRRLLGRLRAAGLVMAQPATGGGWQLTRAPGDITLLAVYRALGEGDLFAMHHRPPNPECRVGRGIQRGLEQTYAEARAALEECLAHDTIAHLLGRVLDPRPA